MPSNRLTALGVTWTNRSANSLTNGSSAKVESFESTMTGRSSRVRCWIMLWARTLRPTRNDPSRTKTKAFAVM